jgi:hypothetical protein
MEEKLVWRELGTHSNRYFEEGGIEAMSSEHLNMTDRNTLALKTV